MSSEKIKLANWVIENTLKNGANEAAVSITKQRQVDIEFRDKQLDKLKESTQNSLTLQVYYEHKFSSHTTNDLKQKTLKKFIEEAVTSTKYLAHDKFRELPDPKYYPKNIDKDLKLMDKNYDKVESDFRVNTAKEIEEIAMAQSDQIISTTAGYSDTYSETTKVHSNGFSGENKGTQFWAGAEVTVKDGEKGRPSDWYWGGARFLKDVPKPEKLGKEAVRRASRKIGQKKFDSGKYTMLVENRSGGRLFGMMQGPLGGQALQQKSSYLEGMLNKKIASDLLTMIDDPFIEKGLGSRLYDGQGLAAKKRMIIENGILNNYYIDNYYAKKLDLEPTSGSTSNIVFKYGEKSLDDMIKEVKKGILVTSFIGGNSNDTTGDFSFGIVGQLIQNGAISGAVNEMNISGNGKEFWNQLAEMGNDPYIFSSRRIPTMLFEDIDFSGI
jgi:PmbA protein